MPKTKPSDTDPAILLAVADYFKVLSEASRLQILTCLKSGSMNVMEIAEVTGLGQANLSKHLKVLTQAGILSRQTKGTSAFYEIVDPMIFDLCDLVCDRITERVLKQAESMKALRNKTAVF
ncbi:helix-turn-helix transcriptional regulator [Anabaena sphaerica FACHB-251]|uniref:Helix-turn-helix transcriptional regulator n=1 Tax=Anabaena sphaerica FACHB-251 TaxID=2692883 RepID=A0A927A1E9_9NOST|nr:metalloregulator ArsR/SmtB family transcription factor [Anabaena sphaerica]MBD2294398.1 helix-turn-helix transcriptional regulator [Anabaena sphaerica FACHB-251]